MSEDSHVRSDACSHNHGHGHSHGPDCDCGCNHSQAETLIEEALVFSKKGILCMAAGSTAEEALLYAVGQVGAVARALAVDGAVLGHVKGLIECGGGQAAFSITRTDCPDITRGRRWVPDAKAGETTLTLNVHSLANTEAPVGELVSGFLAPL